MKLQQLYKLFDNKYEQEVKSYIEIHIPKDKFSAPVYYILESFQLRRFRAAFPLIFAEEFGTDKNKVLPIAAVSEINFAIAIVQDDIIDADNKRGEISASHIKFGTEFCIASCDYVHNLAVNMLGKLRDASIPSRTLEIICDSFMNADRRLYKRFMQERLEANNFCLSIEEIIEIYKDKTIQGTNSLFTSSLVCTENEKIAELIRDYSYDLAIAGQIKNDIYDATSYLENRGYSDLENGYVTYTIRKLLDFTPENEKDQLIKKLISN